MKKVFPFVLLTLIIRESYENNLLIRSTNNEESFEYLNTECDSTLVVVQGSEIESTTASVSRLNANEGTSINLSWALMRERAYLFRLEEFPLRFRMNGSVSIHDLAFHYS